MEPKINVTVVGIFIISLLTSVVLTGIWLTTGFSSKNYSIYMVYMTEAVSGLQINSTVEYNGVDVGEVRTIKIDPVKPNLVQLLLMIKKNTPVTRGTVATLAIRGITNITFIALRDRGTDLRPVIKSSNQPYPVIKSGPSLFTRLDIALSRLANNFRQVSESLNTLLDKQNLQALKKTLANLDQVTFILKENNERLNVIIENTSKATLQLTPFFTSSLNTAQLLQNQTLPAVYRVLSNLNTMSRILSEVAIEIRQDPSVLVRRIQQQPSGPGETTK